jgi:hypothetical protein
MTSLEHFLGLEPNKIFILAGIFKFGSYRYNITPKFKFILIVFSKNTLSYNKLEKTLVMNKLYRYIQLLFLSSFQQCDYLTKYNEK